MYLNLHVLLTMQFKILQRSHLSYAEWAKTDKVPTFEEYLEVGGVGVTMYATIALGLLGLGPRAREQGYEWLTSRPKLVHDLATKGRLMNDLTGFKVNIYDSHCFKFLLLS